MLPAIGNRKYNFINIKREHLRQGFETTTQYVPVQPVQVRETQIQQKRLNIHIFDNRSQHS